MSAQTLSLEHNYYSDCIQDFKSGDGELYNRGVAVYALLKNYTKHSIHEYITHDEVMDWEDAFLLQQVLLLVSGIHDSRVNSLHTILKELDKYEDDK